VKIQADIEVTCFSREGIRAIIPALKSGFGASRENEKVEIHLISTPLYSLHVVSLSKDDGVAVLNDAIKRIADEIKKSNGTCQVKEAPRIVEPAGTKPAAQ
jgi:translation initiation factor 2 subunit 1